MANKFTHNPWIIDTAVAYPGGLVRTLLGTPPSQGGGFAPINVLAFIFSGYTTGNTDQAIIVDQDGTTFLTLQGTSDKGAVGITFPQPFAINNFAVTVITSGRVTVFLTTRSSGK